MKKLVAIAIGVVALSVGCKSSTPAATPLTDEQRSLNAQSFDYTWERIAKTYFKPDRITGENPEVDWEQARVELRPKVEAATTMAESRAVFEELISRLGESHFGVIPAEAYASTGTNERADGDFGMDLRVVDGQAVVFRIEPDGPADKAGLKTGFVITEVGERDLTSGIEAMLDPSRDIAMAPTMANFLIERAATAPVGESVKVSYLDAQDKKQTVELVAKEPTGEEVVFGNLPPSILQTESKTLQSGVGYFRLSIFFNVGTVMPAFSQFIESHQDAPGIIIDLRGNIGGIGAMAMGIGGFLVDETNISLGTMTTRDNTLRFVMNPRNPNYSGKVAVLVDEMSMSTSEFVAGGLKDIGRAKVFGVTTPGAALPSMIETLPNQDRLQFAMADYVSASGERLEGVGVVPDVEVKLDRESLLKGVDPVIAAAVEWITSDASVNGSDSQPSAPGQRASPVDR